MNTSSLRDSITEDRRVFLLHVKGNLERSLEGRDPVGGKMMGEYCVYETCCVEGGRWEDGLSIQVGVRVEKRRASGSESFEMGATGNEDIGGRTVRG